MGDRYDELMAKRRRVGLSDDEANELGRLMAERAGRGTEYANAGNPPSEVETVRALGADEGRQYLQAREKAKEDAQPEEEAGAGTPRDVDDTVMDRRRLSAGDEDFPPPA
ncbi:MAG TPA: hypothetical protein VHL78_06290 [Actinomycetota bacterium]|nr:hypothetical protein [Actinomycetota bacterium]